MNKAYYTLAVFLLLLGVGLLFLPEREHPDEATPREMLSDLRNPSRFISSRPGGGNDHRPGSDIAAG